MSTILKALRRLEDEKQASAETNLRNAVVVEPRQASPRKRITPARLGWVALLLVLAVGSWWSFGWGGAGEVPWASEGPAAAARTPAVIPAVPIPTRAPGLEEVAPAPAVETVERGAPRSTPGQPVTPAQEVVPDVPSPRALSADRELPNDAYRSFAEATPEEEIRRAPETGPAEVVELRSIREARLASELRITVASTVWHPRADRRKASLLLPGASAPIELREGESVNGVRVVEIEPAAVLFERAGHKIRQRVGGGD